jgi:glycosyltransferase involved in cell wall biosynthesis
MLVLKSIEQQSLLPSEVIIADDGSSFETKDKIKKFQKKSKLNIIHSWQADAGFRVSLSRNKAILKSSGDYIILVDGDMILHFKFVEDHFFASQSGFFIQGTRVLLSKSKTKQIIQEKKINFSLFTFGLKNRKNAIYSKFLSKIFTIKNNHIQGIKSCNLAFYRKDFFNVNGFNNEFEGWGREDSELAIRLINSNVNRKNVRFNAIQFHLWHNDNPRPTLAKNNLILENAIINSTTWCENGINSIIENES